MIVAGPALIATIKTDAGKKLYDRVEKEFPVELWSIVLTGIFAIEEELEEK
jgi:hypothetical protein